MPKIRIHENPGPIKDTSNRTFRGIDPAINKRIHRIDELTSNYRQRKRKLNKNK